LSPSSASSLLKPNCVTIRFINLRLILTSSTTNTVCELDEEANTEANTGAGAEDEDEDEAEDEVTD